MISYNTFSNSASSVNCRNSHFKSHAKLAYPRKVFSIREETSQHRNINYCHCRINFSQISKIKNGGKMTKDGFPSSQIGSCSLLGGQFCVFQNDSSWRGEIQLLAEPISRNMNHHNVSVPNAHNNFYGRFCKVYESEWKLSQKHWGIKWNVFLSFKWKNQAEDL